MLNNSTTPSNDGNKATTYIVTPQGVVTLQAGNMSKENFDALLQKLSQFVANEQPNTQATAPSASAVDTSVAPVNTNNAPDNKQSVIDEITQLTGKSDMHSAMSLFEDNKDAKDTKDDLTSLGITFATTYSSDADGFDFDSVNNFTGAAPNGVTPTENIASADPATSDNDDDGIAEYIRSTGYISNNNLWRRWIMAQMLRHYNKADGTSGFDEYFVTGTPYYYQWKVILSELKVLSHLSKSNADELAKRERFFNKSVVNNMAKNYVKKLSTYISKSKKRHDSQYKHVSPSDRHRCIYVDIPGYKKRVYLDPNPLEPTKNNTRGYTTVAKLMESAIRLTNKIQNAHSYYQQKEAVELFMKYCPLVKSFAKDNTWKNAFKGSGAYYTMDNMIKFHSCVFRIGLSDGSVKTLSTKESLEYLEMKTNEYRNEYYKLYALMRKFVADNNFEYSNVPIDDYHLPTYDGE